MPNGFNPRAREGRDIGLSAFRIRFFVTFQSTRPRGARLRRLKFCKALIRVSIHAPARGATYSMLNASRADSTFQSTRPRGARPWYESFEYLLEQMFQSTRPRGARPEKLMMIIPQERFQSTRPRGARLRYGVAYLLHNYVSIHAPARGATYWYGMVADYVRSFNPRAREGRDLCKRRISLVLAVFQSTRPRGARPCMYSSRNSRAMFQSTRPRGARRISTLIFAKWICSFNPRAREGRDFRHSEYPSNFCVSIHAPARGATKKQPTKEKTP